MEWWIWAGGYVVVGSIVAAIESGDERHIDPAFAGFIALIWPMVIFGWAVGHAARRLRALGKRIVR